MAQSETDGDEDTHILTTRLDADRHQELRMEAARQQTSMAELARRYIAEGLDSEDA